MPERYRPPSPDELRARLEQSRQRLANLEAHGTDALSRYDIEIAHGGDTAQALAMAKWLVGNHIAYYTRQLEPFEAVPQQRDFFAQLEQPTSGSSDQEEQEDPAITTP